MIRTYLVASWEPRVRLSWFDVSRTKEDEGGKGAWKGAKEAWEGAKEAAISGMCTSGASLAGEGCVRTLVITMSGSY